jgi:restriction endonuclease S subunit
MECFTVYADGIEGRIDPLYLKNKTIIEEPKTRFALVKLGRLLKSKVQYGANEIAIDGKPRQDIRYIRITDIDEFGNLRSDEWKTAQNIEEKYLLNEGDILFARSGATAGKCFLYKNEYGKSIFAGYLIRFIFDTSKVNPKYIFYYTQLERYKLWVKSIQRPSGQPNINSEEFKSFKIPLLHIQTQNRIAQLMGNAYEIKKQKETEAQQLIDTINEYVLEELSIKLPELKDEMCYVVNADEVKNNRCDAYYYQPKFEEVVEALENGKYNVVLFDVLIKDIKNGVEIRKYSEEGYRYLRVTDLGEFGINDFDPRFVPVEKIPEKILLGDNSFLISRSGSLGLVSVVEEKIKNAILSSHIFKVDLDYNIVLPKYLESYFRSTVGQIQFFRNNNGGIVPEINQLALRSLWIILPPLQIQNKIAEEVKQRMQKAEQLQKEAKEVLEEAKERAERIILGDEEI